MQKHQKHEAAASGKHASQKAAEYFAGREKMKPWVHQAGRTRLEAESAVLVLLTVTNIGFVMIILGGSIIPSPASSRSPSLQVQEEC